jgi:hypothetical protein
MMSKEFKDILRVEGVNSMGFGMIPKTVMQDNRLTRDAKAIYAYFCSYAGNGNTAFPSIELICEHLCFGKEETFRKHLKLLRECDYIRVTQKRDKKGRFNRNIYTLVANPNPVVTEIEDKEVVDRDVNLVDEKVIENEAEDNLIDGEGNHAENQAYIPLKNEKTYQKNANISPYPQKGGDGKKEDKCPNPPYPPFEGDRANGVPATWGYNINSLNINNIYNNNNSNGSKENVVVEKEISSNEIKEKIKNIKQSLKNIVDNKTGKNITDSQANVIIKYYDQNLDRLIKTIKYVESNQPEEGYKRIIGWFKSALDNDYDISIEVPSSNKDNKSYNFRKTKFHNFKGRSDNYSAEELEAIVRKKREGHNIRGFKDESLFERIKEL